MKAKRLLIYLVISNLLVFLPGSLSSSADQEKYDLLIKNAKIIDGTGKGAFKGDVAVKGERIVAVGKVSGAAASIIDAAGLVVCPGFIDPHSHADLEIQKYPLAENLVMQGITTFVGGQCGSSLAPRDKDYYFGMTKEKIGFPVDWTTFGEYLASVEKSGIALNFAPLVGLGTVKTRVMGNDYRRTPTPQEIEAMKGAIEEAMKSGAFGLSSGLDYLPDKFAGFDELVEVAKVVQKYGGLYVPHTRYTNFEWPTQNPEEVCFGRYPGLPENVDLGEYKGVIEAIEVGKKANVRLHIAHISNLYNIFQPHPDYLEEAAAKATIWTLDKAVKEGVDLSFDFVAHANSICKKEKLIDAFYSKNILGLSWVQDFGKKEFVERLKTREFRDRLRRVHDSCQLCFGWVHTKVDPYWADRFIIVKSANSAYDGKIVGEIARSKNADSLETLFDILTEDPEVIWSQITDVRGTEIMNAVFLTHPAAFPSTDVSSGALKPKEGQKAEDFDNEMQGPIAFGLYPHYINNYIKKLKVVSLEEGIKRATWLPAQRFGIKDRGILKAGAYADIVLFNYETIRDKLDFLNPIQIPDGIECVLVNGTIVWRGKAHTGVKPGKVLRHQDLNEIR